ncbi:MAG: homoserine O-succinyltransferase [Lachnospiraceae bacterium]|nr:homoserine O-succinyltransferase [Lachnospiraceae bacterium]RKI24031.1 homoserine O-succinyltransferase [bacterium D16-36]RKI63375.1 homoserine O-succinyltransferase [bacterium 1xD8-6]
MPVKVQNNLPAKKVMEKENIFMMDETRSTVQDIRPLNIVILNLMPLKEDTEIQLLRSLSNTPLQIDIIFMTTASYIGKNTPASHLNQFYKTFDEVRDRKFDGLVITGAPVEQMEFEEVQYWEELKEIMEWSKSNVTSTFHICWGAQAGLYYHYGIHKHLLQEKVFGVYEFRVHHRKEPLLRGFDDVFMAPHSRYTYMDHEEIVNCEKLQVLADSKELGECILVSTDGKQIFVLGHLEYDRLTLDTEYKRDLEKNLPIKLPVNYYPDDDCSLRPLLRWRGACNAVYSNWVNYYVYQETPYEWE